MGTIYIDAALLRANIAIRRDQIFHSLCNRGWDIGTAMIEARNQAQYEYRDWGCYESPPCESEKDIAEYEDEMSLGGQRFKVAP